MPVSSLTRRLRSGVAVRDWAWWHVPLLLRSYVGAVILGAVAAICFEASRTHWRASDLVTFVVLLTCGTISVASTPRSLYVPGSGVTRDFSSVWVLPTAIVLPPIYAALMPIPLVAVTQFVVHRGAVYRRVFTAAALSLTYASSSLVFRSFPPSFAGHAVGSGLHALTWAVAAVAAALVGSRGHHFLLVAAVKLSDPSVKLRDIELNWQAMQGFFAELDLGVLITVAVALTPALVMLALPTVLLVRRFLVHPVLVAQSRADAKTGLLNVSAWEREAEVELSRAIRTHTPLSLAVIDIDHFKAVNDTYGHLTGDRVLRAVADALTSQLRDYDKSGRFGGEEFVVLLPQTVEEDARNIAERLRVHVANLAIPVDDTEGARRVHLTISVGVSTMDGTSCGLTDLLAAADAALYYAKQNGRNMTHAFPAAPMVDGEGQVVDRRDTVAAARQAGPARTSLGPVRSLAVPVTAHHEFKELSK